MQISADNIRVTVTAVARYDFDQKRTPLIALERLINATHGDREARLRIETAMAELLGNGTATVAAKQFVCKKLWIMGTEASIPALAKLLEGSDGVLVEAACYALRTQESAAASTALRNALGKARGMALVAIIDLLGDRRDAASAARLIELSNADDSTVSDAAIAALGKIASKESVAALAKLHRGSSVTRKLSGAHALLQSAQELAQRGETVAAKDVYRQLSSPSEAAHIRRGAQLALARIA